ncbi:hypothetical protein DCAR_0623943 [Daucus carota subsp. sativus]|uniref:DUF8039 domain-containing protein n=1 Tax=Daucus carota subsp. sativus TaxID=79200 RepID=A0AAF1B2U1_DAUCS|nr:hypothetical protein DCAR_0623943 [Daucus carota subsp. sativus]
MDEGNAEQSDTDVSKKRSRGPTLCTKLKQRITNQNLECNISFNEYGDPIGDMLQDFRSYIGSVVRFQVDINIESWEVVDQGLKDAIWDDIKSRWKLDDSRKKNVLERAGKQWRDFKAKLTKKFLREGKDACEKYKYITEEQWKLFKEKRETEEFKRKSEKAKKSQKCNEHVHYLGPVGYAAKRTKWSLQRQVSDGSWTPKGHDDVLTRALGSKEHGGRVRGVGGGAKLKDVFGSGKSKHSGVVSVDELATITQEITKKVQKECEERMNEMVRKNEMVNLKLESIFNQLNQMGVKIPDDHFVNDVSTPNNENVRSSCQVSIDDVVPEYQLTPLPVSCDEHDNIGNAAGSFVQWPKDLVTLGQLKDDTFAFMLPSRLAMPHKCHQQRQDEAIDYLSDFLVANRNKRYILAPYIQEAFKLYVSQGGQRNNKKEFLWHHTECPQQGDMDSGFFVMRYMYDIVMLSQKQPDMNWKFNRRYRPIPIASPTFASPFNRRLRGYLTDAESPVCSSDY